MDEYTSNDAIYDNSGARCCDRSSVHLSYVRNQSLYFELTHDKYICGRLTYDKMTFICF